MGTSILRPAPRGQSAGQGWRGRAVGEPGALACRSGSHGRPVGLKLQQDTVKDHLQHLLLKLGVKNRTEVAMKFAAEERPRGA